MNTAAQKQPYNKPETTILDIVIAPLLGGSDPTVTKTDDKADNNYDALTRRRRNIWEDDEEEDY